MENPTQRVVFRAYIFNIPRSTTPQQLEREIRAKVKIKSIEKSKNKGKNARMFAIVTLYSQEDLQRLLSSEISVNGSIISIEKFKDYKEI